MADTQRCVFFVYFWGFICMKSDGEKLATAIKNVSPEVNKFINLITKQEEI